MAGPLTRQQLQVETGGRTGGSGVRKSITKEARHDSRLAGRQITHLVSREMSRFDQVLLRASVQKDTYSGERCVRLTARISIFIDDVSCSICRFHISAFFCHFTNCCKEIEVYSSHGSYPSCTSTYGQLQKHKPAY